MTLVNCQDFLADRMSANNPEEEFFISTFCNRLWADLLGARKKEVRLSLTDNRNRSESDRGEDMQKIRCSEVWGGIQSREADLQAAGISVSLFSHAADGDKGGDIYYVSV